MKKYFSVLIILLGFLGIHTQAQEVIPPQPGPISIHLTITTNTDSVYNQNISVNACNSDNGATTDLKVTAYCAILQSEIPSDWNWGWPPGAFLNSLNNVAGFTTKDTDGNDVYHYWSWSLNGTEGIMGLNQYELQPSDLISLTFVDPVPPTPEPEITPPPISHGGGGMLIKTQLLSPAIKPVFDSKKAFEFLISQQKGDSSFGQDLYTDWTAFALGATSDYQNQKAKLAEYLKKNKLSGALLTDYERRAMALMALGLNPYDVNGENYIKKITDGFDGKQFGDISKDNDDVFALIVLQNAGFGQNEGITKNTIDFLLSKQKEDGSWDNSVDMTGAAIQAIAPIAEKNRAKEFLKQNQKDDGGFGNVSSTAWAIGGILALGEKPADWVRNNNSPLDYLAQNQDTDGGIKNENKESKLWETVYALSALSGKSWNQIMQKFDPVRNRPRIASATVASGRPVSNGTKITKIQKVAEDDIASPVEAIIQNQNLSEPAKEQSWFRRLINKIFGF